MNNHDQTGMLMNSLEQILAKQEYNRSNQTSSNVRDKAREIDQLTSRQMSPEPLRSCPMSPISLNRAGSLRQPVQRIRVGSSGNQPKCFGCGLAIWGAPVKLSQKQVMHPHCLVCTTCGSPLEVPDYSFINDKLYCHIHAVNRNKSQDTSTASISSSPGQMSPVPAPAPPPPPPPPPPASLSQANTLKPLPKGPPPPNHAVDNGKSPVGGDLNETGPTQPSSGIKVWATKPEELHYVLCDNKQLKQRNHSSAFSVEVLAPAQLPICCNCNQNIIGPHLTANDSIWCKPCGEAHFNCSLCKKSLISSNVVETGNDGKFHCEQCFENEVIPICSKCNLKIRGDCLMAMDRKWHPDCFVCGHCKQTFDKSSFQVQDDVPYCKNDWNLLFTTKCSSCNFAIEMGAKWIEALNKNYHSDCFRCTMCQQKLEGATFDCKNGKPYCKIHAK